MLAPVSNFFAPYPFTVDYAPTANASDLPSISPATPTPSANVLNPNTDTVVISAELPS